MRLKLMSILIFLAAVVCVPHAYADRPQIACIIPYYPDIVFWSDIESSIYQAADELDAELLMLYTKHTESNLELSLDEALSISIYSDADAIITSYTLAGPQTDQWLAAARQKEIPVIMIDCDCPEELRSAYIGIDNESIGYDIGKMALDGLQNTDRALLVYSSSSLERNNLLLRIQGIRRAFSQSGERLREHVISTNNVQAVLEIREIMESDPSITTIIPISENSTLLCAQAVSSSVEANKVHLYGFDESEDTLELLESSVIEALACQINSEMGYKSVQTAKALIDGDHSAAGIHLIDCIIRTHSD